VTAEGTWYEGTGNWTFSTGSNITAQMFATYAEDQCCFSASGGAWGLGEATVHGRPVVAWGQGNFGGSDAADCSAVYMDGKLHRTAGKSATSYFYIIDEKHTAYGQYNLHFRVSLVRNDILW
jgi:hypothetical protein